MTDITKQEAVDKIITLSEEIQKELESLQNKNNIIPCPFIAEGCNKGCSFYADGSECIFKNKPS
jgi:hypothetical protein